MPHTDWRLPEASAVLVSPVVGEGADARRLVRVGDWQFTSWLACGDAEPRMRDLDGAERLKLGEITAEGRAHLAAHGDPRQTSLPLAN